MPATVRPATPDDEALVIDTLVRAFDDDPIVNWLLRRDAGRARAFREFYRITFTRFAIQHGASFIASDDQRDEAPGNTGVALWIPPNAWQLGVLEQVKLAPYFLRCVGLGGIGRALKFLGGMDQVHPHDPHWYLLVVGVCPQAQGLGLGRALIEPTLERCDREGLPAYLETTKPSNVPYYRRFGFEVREEIELGGDAPPFSTMWRAPS